MNPESLLGSAHHSMVYEAVHDLAPRPNPFNGFFWNIDEVLASDVSRNLHWPLVDYMNDELDQT